MAIYSSIPTGKIPWTEELVDYSPWGQKDLDITEHSTTQQIGKSYLLFVILCITVDSCAVERNNTEESDIPFTSFPQ